MPMIFFLHYAMYFLLYFLNAQVKKQKKEFFNRKRLNEKCNKSEFDKKKKSERRGGRVAEECLPIHL